MPQNFLGCWICFASERKAVSEINAVILTGVYFDKKIRFVSHFKIIQVMRSPTAVSSAEAGSLLLSSAHSAPRSSRRSGKDRIQPKGPHSGPSVRPRAHCHCYCPHHYCNSGHCKYALN